MQLATLFLESFRKRILYYKELADRTFTQLDNDDFHFRESNENNSIAIIIRHMHGNMLSRFTNFLTEDGEKEGRNRDSEFEEQHRSKDELLRLWEEGWSCFLSAVLHLKEEELYAIITIRSEPLTVLDALNRQMAHYSYHIGQIVYIGRMIKGPTWENLSIPNGASDFFNQQLKTKK